MHIGIPRGKLTGACIAIGKTDEEIGMLIPNRNYYEYFHKKISPKMSGIIRSTGNYIAFFGVARKFGLGTDGCE